MIVVDMASRTSRYDMKQEKLQEGQDMKRSDDVGKGRAE